MRLWHLKAFVASWNCGCGVVVGRQLRGGRERERQEEGVGALLELRGS